MTFQCDKRYIVAVRRDGKAGVWSARSGALLHMLSGNSEPVVRVELAPDGKTAITSSYLPPNELMIPSKDDSIRLWEIATGKLIYRINNAVYGQFSNDGKRIYGFVPHAGAIRGSGSSDIAAWNTTSGKKLFTWRASDQGVFPNYNHALEEDSSSSRLLFADGRQAWIFDPIAGKLVAGPLAISAPFGNVTFLPGADAVEAAGASGVETYSLPTGKRVGEFKFQGKIAFWTVGWQRDSAGFAALDTYGHVAFYNPKKGLKEVDTGIGWVPISVLVCHAKPIFVVNFGANASWSGTTAFNGATCSQVWKRKDRVLGIDEKDEVVLRGGSQLSFIDAASGRVIRVVRLMHFEAGPDEPKSKQGP